MLRILLSITLLTCWAGICSAQLENSETDQDWVRMDGERLLMKFRGEVLMPDGTPAEDFKIKARIRESVPVKIEGHRFELEAELKKLKQIAADTLRINEKNEKLAASLERAESRQASLQVENERLRNNTEQAWFIRGAGVILLGMLLGLLIPKLRFKKKRKWGDFSNY